jgi:hypothetical protein
MRPLCALLLLARGVCGGADPKGADPACQKQCDDEGQCCTGLVSSYNLPSCAMGCQIATVVETEKACLDACTKLAAKVKVQGKPDANPPCTAEVGGLQLQLCQTCPCPPGTAVCPATARCKGSLEGCKNGCTWAKVGKTPSRPRSWANSSIL